MRSKGTLRDVVIYEPTTDEYHPNSTRYESPTAPIAINFFPYNLCDVHDCTQCHRAVMRYTAFGGYYVDHRVREVSRKLMV